MKRSGILLGVLAMALAATGAFAGDWHKIGSATLVFKDPQIEIKVDGSAEPCSQIRLRASGEMVSVASLTLYFVDGTTQDVDLPGVLREGVASDPIAIEDGPKKLDRVELAHNAQGRGGALRAQIIVQATS